MLAPGALVVRYGAFALAAIVVNVVTQDLVTGVYAGPYALWAGILAGTGTGLVTKYFLDRRWIFGERRAGLAEHSRKFTLYTLMGGATTLIFWGTEWSFDRLSGGDELWRYTGAVLGLVVGYALKYRLDKRFVFAGGPS